MQEHGTLLLLAIHQNSHRMLEANMAHILRFLYRRHRIQYLLIDESSFFCVCIYRKVTYPERGKILEEMGTLTWVDIIVLQRYFYDDTGGTDMRPLDRNA